VESRGLIQAAALLFLGGTAAVVLLVDDRTSQVRQARADVFEGLVGGCGFGPAVDLSGCAFGFDPRLDGCCAQDFGPLLGGGCFCPRHAGSVFAYPRLQPRNSDQPAAGK